MINAYCHELALRGGARLAEVLGTRVLDSDARPGELTANMVHLLRVLNVQGSLFLPQVNVELPFPPHIAPTKEVQVLFTTKLLRHATYVPVFPHGGRWWALCSAQVWNEVSGRGVSAGGC